MLFRLLTFAILLTFASIPRVDAQTSFAFGNLRASSEEPVEVTADQLEVDQDAGLHIFSGNVIVIQGDMRLTGAVVEVFYSADQSEIERIKARDNVVLVSGEDVAESQKLDYDVAGGFIVMTEDVLVLQGLNALSSQEMEIDIDASTALMTGRVKTVLQPSSND